jgi:hypothetical protein
MENIQGNQPPKVKSSYVLSGPLTWIILLVFVLSIFGFGLALASDSPAITLRRFFTQCFEGQYSKSWEMVKPDSDYAKQFNGDPKVFEEMWTRTKTHGTTYLKIRIDGVTFSAKSTSDRQIAVVAYSIMTKEQSKDSEGVVTNQINDANLGFMTMEKLKGQGWKLVMPNR